MRYGGLLFCIPLLWAQNPPTSTLPSPQDKGCYGETFAIQERNFLKVLQQRMQQLAGSGQLIPHQDSLREHIARHIKNPPPVSGVRHTTRPRTFTYNPTYVLEHDITGPQGQLLYPQGTRINPLHYVSLKRPLLLIDGEAHGQWLQKQRQIHPHAVVILVKGSPFSAHLQDEKLTPIYFDQEGVLSKKLHVEQVPARVTQQGSHLLIEEVEP